MCYFMLNKVREAKRTEQPKKERAMREEKRFSTEDRVWILSRYNGGVWTLESGSIFYGVFETEWEAREHAEYLNY